jgi:hypothetical protein
MSRFADLQTLSFPYTRIPHDCLALLESFYPFTLSSFYETYMSNKTQQVRSVALELRDRLLRNQRNQSDSRFLSSLQFHIQPERLKLFHDLSSSSSSATVHVPYEFYIVEDNYLSTGWNIIESTREELLQPTHDFFDINGYHTVEQGIFLQPTIAELYANATTRVAALLLIAHELGHALCPCGVNLTEREYFADLIALPLIIDYHEQQLNGSRLYDDIRTFFITYGQSECVHINREMIHLMGKDQNLVDLHVTRVLQSTERFQALMNCSAAQQHHRTKHTGSLLPELCAACRRKNS